LSLLRLTFIFIYTIFAAGFCIQVFTVYGINYLYIFELDPNAKMTHDQLYRVGTILFSLWSACFAISLMQIRLEWLFRGTAMWFMLVLAIVMLFYCAQPCLSCGYRTARKQLAITIWEIVISPFGRVRFRDFFFADVITSMGEPLKDIANCIFFLVYIKDIHKQHHPEDNLMIRVYYIVVSFLPFWWRFWQCINKWYYTGLRLQLVNAGKYFSKLVPPLILVFYPTGKKGSD
jgi:hypothetical protein